MTGVLIPECRLPWVENIFVPGHKYYEAYRTMREAYDRLCLRLGVEEEDEDVEILRDSLMDYGKISSMKMFEYGRAYGRMQAAEDA